jgi:hypothetical protein
MTIASPETLTEVGNMNKYIDTLSLRACEAFEHLRKSPKILLFINVAVSHYGMDLCPVRTGTMSRGALIRQKSS